MGIVVHPDDALTGEGSAAIPLKLFDGLGIKKGVAGPLFRGIRKIIHIRRRIKNRAEFPQAAENRRKRRSQLVS